jgi:DNA end-binding protein Ku
VRSHRVRLHQIHLADKGRVRYRKVCELDQEELRPEDIGRAYDAGGELVPVSDDELDAMPLPTARAVEISGFLTVSAVPAESLDKPYFLSPASPAANKPYVLMREALKRSGKAGVGKFAMRGSERLGLVRPYGDVLVLHTLHWPDELNPAGDAAPRRGVEISQAESAAADALIQALGEADMSEFHDEYARALEALIAARAEGAEPPVAAEPAPAAGGADLMAVLEESTRRAQKGADVHHLADRQAEKKPAGKKTAGVAAKKTAGKRASPKKTARRPRRAG